MIYRFKSLSVTGDLVFKHDSMRTLYMNTQHFLSTHTVDVK